MIAQCQGKIEWWDMRSSTATSVNCYCPNNLGAEDSFLCCYLNGWWMAKHCGITLYGKNQ